MSVSNSDEREIRELIAAQAKRLSWSPDRPGDWEGYKSGFHPDALMVASSRPAKTQAVDAFLGRMKALAGGSLRSFAERALGGQVHVFGNIAVAIIAGETLENDKELNRDVSGYLLVKDADRWSIVAQAWDKATPEQCIPDAMLTPG
jgi:hypothetical protein